MFGPSRNSHTRMGSDGGMRAKETPSVIRRWINRSRIILILRYYRSYVAFSLIFFVIFLLYLYGQGSQSSLARVQEQSQQPIQLTKKPLQKTKNGRLFYNRVPKCGSSTLVELLKKLSVKNGFRHSSSPLLDDWAIFNDAALADFVKEFNSAPPRSSFDRHLFFLDFANFGQANPIYINMIRDPTERFISEFYFRRRLQNEGVKKGERKWYDEDLENCVRTGKDYDCRLIDGKFIKNMMGFFCGHDLDCAKHNNPEALKRAKINVDRHFAVVGILEDLDMTLSVLERKLPQYFAGAQDLHASNPDYIINKGKNRVERVSEEVKQMIRANLTVEYQFYDFIRTRLIAQSKGEL